MCGAAGAAGGVVTQVFTQFPVALPSKGSDHQNTCCTVVCVFLAQGVGNQASMYNVQVYEGLELAVWPGTWKLRSK